MSADEPAVERVVCRQCFAVLDATDNYCRNCGMATPRLVAGAPADSKPLMAELVPGRAPSTKGSESPWIVLPMLFLVAGPLALPMLWRSREFSVLWKAILTIVVVGLTLFVVWAIWFLYQKAVAPLQELRGLPGFY